MSQNRCMDCKHFVIRAGSLKTRYLCSKRSYLDMSCEPFLNVLPEVSPADSCGLWRGINEPELPALTNGAIAS